MIQTGPFKATLSAAIRTEDRQTKHHLIWATTGIVWRSNGVRTAVFHLNALLSDSVLHYDGGSRIRTFGVLKSSKGLGETRRRTGPHQSANLKPGHLSLPGV